MTGINNTKTALAFLLAATTTVRSTTADGSIGIADTLKFIGLAKEARAAFDAIKDTPSEFEDLDPEEAAELVQFVAAKLEIKVDDRAAKIAERALALLPGLMHLWQAFGEQAAAET